MKLKTAFLIASTLVCAGLARGEDVRYRTTVQTIDGTTSVRPVTLKVSNSSLTDNGNGVATLVTGGTITGVTAGTGMSGGGSSGAVTLTNAGVVSIATGTGLSGTATTGAITLSTLISTYSVTAAGTVYSLTTTTAAVTFGTTSPSVTIGGAGTYLILARVNIKYNSATFAANRTVKLTLKRTNNTAAYITASETNLTTRIITTITDDMGDFLLPPQIYTTTTASDAIAIWANIDTGPTAGTTDINEANVVAVRLF